MGGTCGTMKRKWSQVKQKAQTHAENTQVLSDLNCRCFLCAVVVMMSILVSTETFSCNYLLMALSPSTPPLVSPTAGAVSHTHLDINTCDAVP